MTSAWWLLVAFIGGGSAGILLMALMRLAGGLPEQSDQCARGSIGSDPIRIPGRQEKFAVSGVAIRLSTPTISPTRMPKTGSSNVSTSNTLRPANGQGGFPCPTIQCITLRVIGWLFRTGPGEHAFAVSIAVLRTKRRSWAEPPKVSTAPRIVSARDGSESR